jgi:hypothetical protein
MDLFGVKCLSLLLERCAETLETLRLYPTNPYGQFFSEGEEVDSSGRFIAKILCFDLSQIKTLRTFETTAQSITYAGRSSRGFLKTLLSSVAFPGMLDVTIIYRDGDFGEWGFYPVYGTSCLRKGADRLDYFSWQLKV